MAPATPPAVPPIGIDRLPEPLATVLRPRVERLGYLGEFFQRTAHQPGALLAFHGFTEAAKQALGPGLTELVALTLATELGNDYERHQHERLSVRSGRGRAWVAAVERCQPADAALLDQQERLAQAVALAAVRDAGPARGRQLRPLVDGYAGRYGAAAAVALLFVVGRYLAHTVVVDALGIEPPVPSVFEDGFGGDADGH